MIVWTALVRHGKRRRHRYVVEFVYAENEEQARQSIKWHFLQNRHSKIVSIRPEEYDDEYLQK